MAESKTNTTGDVQLPPHARGVAGRKQAELDADPTVMANPKMSFTGLTKDKLPDNRVQDEQPLVAGQGETPEPEGERDDAKLNAPNENMANADRQVAETRATSGRGVQNRAPAPKAEQPKSEGK